MKIKGNVFNTDLSAFVPCQVEFDGGVIKSIEKIADGGDVYVIPGFVEVHTHGRCGFDVMAATEDELSDMSLEYAKAGVTSMYPTVMTAPIDKIRGAIKRIASAKVRGARFAGVHVEGPYISEKKPGCHNIPDIRMPDGAEMTDLVNLASPLRTHFTVAPEKCPDGLIRTLSKSATVGIGHTAADFDTAMAAVREGAVSFTHTFNAMTGLAHRSPGTVGAALCSDAYAEFIVDGFHIAPEVVGIAYRAKKNRNEKFVLITDSIPQAGLSDGRYEMNGITFNLSGKSATEDNGTIVGSVLDMMTAVKNLSEYASIPFEEALVCATKNPAEMVGIYDKVGSIDVGKLADFAILDKDKKITSVIIGGERII